MSNFRGSQVQQGKGAAATVDSLPSQQQLTGSQINSARSVNFPSHFDLLSPRAMGTFNSSEPPESPPDAMDLARPDFEAQNPGILPSAKSSLRSVRPLQQNLSDTMVQKPTESFPERLSAIQSTVTGSNPVMLEKRFTPTLPAPSSSTVPPVSGNPNSVQGNSRLEIPLQHPTVESAAKTAQSSPPGKSETNKLTPQELERIRINRASEYYRLQREKLNELNRIDAKEDHNKSTMSPLSPPPSRPANRLTSKSSPTTAALRASRIVKNNRQQPNLELSTEEPNQASVLTGNVQTRTLCVDDTMSNSGLFAPAAGSQPILDSAQVQNQIVSALIASDQQILAPQPQVLTSQQQAIVPRQSPVVLTARNPSHVFNGNPAITTSVNPGQTSTSPSNQPPTTISPSYQTVTTKMTQKTFSQHWVMLGKDLPVLLLDFSRSFSLLIPNVSAGNSFHSNNTSVEVLQKTLASGQQVTFMKFLFESPTLTIEAPVLSDRPMMFKVLKSNSACVLLACILADVKKPAELIQPLVQAASTVTPQQVIVTENSQVMVAGENFVVGVPKLPPGTVIVPQDGAIQLFEPQQSQQQYYEVYTDLMDAAATFVQQPLQQQQQQQEFFTSQGLLQQPFVVRQESQGFAQAGQPINLFSPTKTSASALNALTSSVISPSNLDLLQQPSTVNFSSPGTPVSNDFAHHSPAAVTSPTLANHNSPAPSTVPASSVPDFSHRLPVSTVQQQQLPQPQTMPALPQKTVVVPSAAVAQPLSRVQPEESVPRLIYPDMLTDSIYKCLKPDELKKIECCRYCNKKFKFLSEHLAHMKVHTQDVESVCQMSINIWIQGRKLKCDHCKHKYSYTLDYAKHVDTHPFAGLACRICQCEVISPKEYGEHMEIHHPSVIFAKPAPEPQQEQQQPQMEPQLQQEELGILANEQAFKETTNQVLLSTTSSVFNGSPTDSLTKFDQTGSGPSAVFGSNEPSNNSLLGFSQTGSSELVNPMTDHSVDFLNEDAVFESIMNSENQSGVTPTQPTSVQNDFSSSMDMSHVDMPHVDMSHVEMSHVDMPILEASESVDTGLDQRDEDFLRELTNFDYSANAQTEKTEEANLVNFIGENETTTEPTKSRQEEESIDDEVRDLVRDLGGKIAAQSFGFDKEDSIPFGFSDNEDGDAEKSSKGKGQQSQDQNFNKMLSENLSPAFRPSLTPIRPGETPLLCETNSVDTSQDQATSFSSPLQISGTSKMFDSIPISEKSNSSILVENGLNPGSIFAPASNPAPALHKSQEEAVVIPPADLEMELLPFGGLEGASESKKSSEGFVEDEKDGEEEDLDLQLYLSDNSEEGDGDGDSKIDNVSVHNLIEKLVEDKSARLPKASLSSPIDGSGKTLEHDSSKQSDEKSVDWEQSFEIQDDSDSEEEPISVPVLFNCSSPKLVSPVTSKPVNPSTPKQVNPVAQNQLNSSIDDGSESSDADVHRCQTCAEEFRSINSLKIHRTTCIRVQSKNSKNLPEIAAKSDPKPKISPPKTLRLSSSSSSSDEFDQEDKCEFCNDRFRSEASLKMHRFICRKKNVQKLQKSPKQLQKSPKPAQKSPNQYPKSPKQLPKSPKSQLMSQIDQAFSPKVQQKSPKRFPKSPKSQLLSPSDKTFSPKVQQKSPIAKLMSPNLAEKSSKDSLLSATKEAQLSPFLLPESHSPIPKLKITSPGFSPRLEKVERSLGFGPGEDVFHFSRSEMEERKLDSKKPEIGIKLKLTKPAVLESAEKKRNKKKRKDRNRVPNRVDDDDSSSDDNAVDGDVCRSKKKSQALSNCFASSLLTSRISKVQKPEEKKVVEPIKIKKLVEPEHVSPTPKPLGLKLTINLKKSSVSKTEVVKELADQPKVSKEQGLNKKVGKKLGENKRVIQQPLLGKLVVRKEKKVAASRSILFPPVVMPPTIQEEPEKYVPEIVTVDNGKKKNKKDKRQEKKEENGPPKVPKLVIKRDAIVPVANSRNKDVHPVNFPLTSPPSIPADVPDPSTPPSTSRSIKILPLKKPANESQVDELQAVKGQRPKGRNGKKAKTTATPPPQRKTRLSNRTNSVASTDSSNEMTKNNDPELANVKAVAKSEKCEKSRKNILMLRPVVPRLKIRLGPTDVESGKKLSAVLSDLVQETTKEHPQEHTPSTMSVDKTTRSFDDILNERKADDLSVGGDATERTCVVHETDIGNALSVLLSLEVEREVVGKILAEILTKVVEDSERSEVEAEVESVVQQVEEAAKEKEKKFRSLVEVKSGLKMILTRKDDQFLAAKSDESLNKSEVEKPDEFAIIRVPNPSRTKPKRSGSGLSRSDYTKRRARRKLDKIIIKNLSRLSKNSSVDDESTADEREPLASTPEDLVVADPSVIGDAPVVKDNLIDGINVAVEGIDADESRQVCAVLLDELIGSLLLGHHEVENENVQALKVPPLKIKSSQLNASKKKKKNRKGDNKMDEILKLKEEDVCFKRVVPPLKLVLGQAKKQETVETDAIHRELKVILQRIDIRVELKNSGKATLEAESPAGKKLKRKIEVQAKGGSNKRLRVTKSSTVKHIGSTTTSKQVENNDGKKSESQTANFSDNKTIDPENLTTIRSRSLSEKSVIKVPEKNANKVPEPNVDNVPEKTAEKSSTKRRCHPSAAGKLESCVEAMYRPRKSILEAFSESHRRHSTPDLASPKSKSVPVVATSNPKPVSVSNPPVFARKSIPKLVDHQEDNVPTVDLSHNPESVEPKALRACPSILKPVILEAKKVSENEDIRVPSPVKDAKSSEPIQADSGSAENVKQGEENLVIRKAIDIIRQTPDTDKVFNMIDELFDNVMVIYKSDKPEQESALICRSILDDLISSAILEESLDGIDSCSTGEYNETSDEMSKDSGSFIEKQNLEFDKDEDSVIEQEEEASTEMDPETERFEEQASVEPEIDIPTKIESNNERPEFEKQEKVAENCIEHESNVDGQVPELEKTEVSSDEDPGSSKKLGPTVEEPLPELAKPDLVISDDMTSAVEEVESMFEKPEEVLNDPDIGNSKELESATEETEFEKPGELTSELDSENSKELEYAIKEIEFEKPGELLNEPDSENSNEMESAIEEPRSEKPEEVLSELGSGNSKKLESAIEETEFEKPGELTSELESENSEGLESAIKETEFERPGELLNEPDSENSNEMESAVEEPQSEKPEEVSSELGSGNSKEQELAIEAIELEKPGEVSEEQDEKDFKEHQSKSEVSDESKGEDFLQLEQTIEEQESGSEEPKSEIFPEEGKSSLSQPEFVNTEDSKPSLNSENVEAIAEQPLVAASFDTMAPESGNIYEILQTNVGKTEQTLVSSSMSQKGSAASTSVPIESFANLADIEGSVHHEAEVKQTRRRSLRTSVTETDESEPIPKLRRKNTRSLSVVSPVEIVGNVLNVLISDAVYLSESKSSKEEAWTAILATARPTPGGPMSSPEMRFSSEVETDDELVVFSNSTDLNLKNCLPYQYNYIDDDSTRESSCNNETSQDEMSSDETILRAKKSRQQQQKKSSASPFSRSSYVSRRRVQKRPLPMSSLAKTSSPGVTQASLKVSAGDVCSSPSNTESGKENDANFVSLDARKSNVKKETSDSSCVVVAEPSSTLTSKRESATSSRSTPSAIPAPVAATASALLPQVSSAIFVRDEFDSTGEDVLHFGKGKRKRFLNVRMFPIGDTMSQKIMEVSGRKNIPTKKPKIEIEERTQRRGSVDSTSNVRKVDNVGEYGQKCVVSVSVTNSSSDEKRRKSADDDDSANSTTNKKRSSSEKRRNSGPPKSSF